MTVNRDEMKRFIFYKIMSVHLICNVFIQKSKMFKSRFVKKKKKHINVELYSQSSQICAHLISSHGIKTRTPDGTLGLTL